MLPVMKNKLICPQKTRKSAEIQIKFIFFLRPSAFSAGVSSETVSNQQLRLNKAFRNFNSEKQKRKLFFYNIGNAV